MLLLRSGPDFKTITATRLRELLGRAGPPSFKLVLEPTPEIPGGSVDRVHFTVTSPPIVMAGVRFVVDVWAHLGEQRETVVRLAKEAMPESKLFVRSQGPKEVARGAILTVFINIEGMIVEEPQKDILWVGEIGKADFVVAVPTDILGGPKAGSVSICIEGARQAKINFLIEVGRTTSDVDHLRTTEERHRRAFASYTEADRPKVLARVQGMQVASPQMDIYMDVLSLRSGQYWAEEVRKEIQRSDVFYLFWSANAAKSRWVRAEWRYALKKRGIGFIDPVPLVPPPPPDPPPELASKHFGDKILAYMCAAKPGSAH